MHPGFTNLTYMTDSGSHRLKRKRIRTADDLPINGEERYVSYGEFVPNIPVFVKFRPRPIQNLLSILLLLCWSKVLLISNAREAPEAHTPYSPFSASLQTFCLTVRAYLNT